MAYIDTIGTRAETKRRGATLCRFDGSPFAPTANVLWDYAAAATSRSRLRKPASSGRDGW
ncbi:MULTISPECIES: hypothetical protein [unclassified Mesorhizobium]|uniref:hypothetical protein n=1 Tax=unclassified Mesorhizobium TaxID=325217 RepID=UPI0033350DE1